MARSISLVEVLPTEPVTATTRASVRARPAFPSASSPSSTSSTIKSGASGDTPSGTRLTKAAAAPFSSACATNSCPSRAAVSATNKSPGSMVRVSIDTPKHSHSTVTLPPVALAAAPDVQRLMRSPHPVPPQPRWPVHNHQTATHRHLRSGRFRDPCPRSTKYLPAPAHPLPAEWLWRGHPPRWLLARPPSQPPGLLPDLRCAGCHL
mmetsp:Transcript_28852/g.54927  ORF Transcript_28852/g.54927 Transcript_28852/m.54927 type:complete len:207 (-) Transcript_28852:4144-4764(-)